MHNPLRSETEVFWAVVAIAAGAAAIIALTLITRPLFGAILLVIELVVGSWVLLRRARGTMPVEPEVAHREDPVPRHPRGGRPRGRGPRGGPHHRYHGLDPQAGGHPPAPRGWVGQRNRGLGGFLSHTQKKTPKTWGRPGSYP